MAALFLHVDKAIPLERHKCTRVRVAEWGVFHAGPVLDELRMLVGRPPVYAKDRRAGVETDNLKTPGGFFAVSHPGRWSRASLRDQSPILSCSELPLARRSHAESGNGGEAKVDFGTAGGEADALSPWLLRERYLGGLDFGPPWRPRVKSPQTFDRRLPG
jgi:hypothetical protein